jgi:hypothetical protein
MDEHQVGDGRAEGEAVVVPNLFHDARGERAQDAVLAWLARWASPRMASVDRGLHAAGTRLLECLLGRPVPDLVDLYVDTQAGSDGNRPDLIIKLNPGHAILVEDKVHAIPGPTQLQRYRDNAHSLCGVPTTARVDLVYLKTGIIKTPHTVEALGYRVVDRRRLIEILRAARRETSHPVVADFLEHLKRIDSQVHAWESQSPGAFGHPKDLEWQGLFQALYVALSRAGIEGDWGVVNAPTGSFAAMWWGFCPNGDGTCLYAQAHAHEGVGARVGIRLNHPERVPGDHRPQWLARILESPAPAGWHFQRPRRFGSGKSVEVAAHVRPWWIDSAAGGVDIERTATRLGDVAGWVQRLAQTFRDDAPGSTP